MRVRGDPKHEGVFPQGAEPQRVTFAEPLRGHYFALEALDAHDGGTQTSMADLTLYDAEDKKINSRRWQVVSVSSEEIIGASAGVGSAINGQISNFWITQWKDAEPSHPHWLVIDLGREEELGGLVYVPPLRHRPWKPRAVSELSRSMSVPSSKVPQNNPSEILTHTNAGKEWFN